MKKKSDKKNCFFNLDYIQLSVPAFLDTYPEFISAFPLGFLMEFLSEPEYVVRFFPGCNRFEVGFPGDDWQVFG